MDAPIVGIAFFDTNFIYKSTARVTAANNTACDTPTLTLNQTIAGVDTRIWLQTKTADV
jgi:hypothetical protein